MIHKTYWKKSSLLLNMLAVILISFTGCDAIADNEADTDPVENLPNKSGFPIVGTNQATFFNNSTMISRPSAGDDFYGQNAQYPGNTPQYVNNGDGTGQRAMKVPGELM